MLYAIKAVGTEFVKFGIARKPHARLAELQTGSPHNLVLLAFVWTPNDSDVEELVHSAFHGERVRGEWFMETPRTKQFVRRMQNPRSYLPPGLMHYCLSFLADEAANGHVKPGGLACGWDQENPLFLWVDKAKVMHERMP